jgi:hypothetical protein
MHACVSLLASCLLGVACGAASSEDPGRSAVNADSIAGSEGCPSELVSTKLVRGMIFTKVCNNALADSVQRAASERVVGYFRPTVDEIQTLESRMRPALEHGLKEPDSVAYLSPPAEDREEDEWGVRGALAGILKDFVKYRRQYVGIVVLGGARRVLVNSFPEVGADGKDDYGDWKLRWIDYVDDGAWEFWRIQYDLASGRFLGFECNPSG